MLELIVAGAGLVAGGAALVRQSTRVNSTIFGPGIAHGSRSRPGIALTFDDGPSPSTPKVLDILSRYAAPATFFQCGTNVRRLPEIAREVVSRGHLVGNHTETHPHFWFETPWSIYRELASAQNAIESATSVRPAFFRPPCGIRWFGLQRAESRLGMLRVLWSAIGYDWMLPAQKVAEHLTARAENGAIFCLHDGRGTAPDPDITSTLEALELLLPALRERGYRFETIADIVRS